MTSFNNVGFDVKYPPGCREIQDGLKTDELKRRLLDLMKALEEMVPETQDSMLNETNTVDSVDNLLAQDQPHRKPIEEYRGLAYILRSESLLDHPDKDVQIRTGVCLTFLIRYFCPNNIFDSFTDSKDIIKSVLDFLLKCIDEISRCKSKNDRHFLNLFKILTISCQIDVFHWHTLLEEEGEHLLVNCFRVMFNVIRRLNDWSQEIETKEALKTVTDTLANLILSCDPTNNLPDKLVQFLLNFLIDRSALICQKQIAVELITRCSSKLEDQIQSLLQSFLLQDDNISDINKEETAVSEPSDDDEDDLAGQKGGDDNDDMCSLDSYRRLRKMQKTQEKMKAPYGGHTFQLMYEIYKINESIIAPILPMLDVKLKSVSCTDRKRACRLLGKLFSGTTNSNIADSSGKLTGISCAYRANLWDGLLGRFMDIETEVREVCIRVARDLLLLDPNSHPGLAREDLARALDKRSHDQDDNIRLQVVLAIVDVMNKSIGVMSRNDDLPVVEEILLSTLIDRARDRSLDTRKSAYSYLGKLYRSIIEASSMTMEQSVLKLSPKLRERAELVLNKILRLYQRIDVNDRIIVERLFNTCIVPYQMSLTKRVKSLLYCFTLAHDCWLKSLQEMWKTQRMALQELRQAIQILCDLDQGSSSTNKALNLPTDVSTKLRENVRILSDYLPGKDRLENLTKMFNIIRHDRKLLEQFRIFVNIDSSRSVLLKCINEIKRIINVTENAHPHGGSGVNVGNVNSQKKKALNATVKCLLERVAPIIIDKDFCQETISYLVSANEYVVEEDDITTLNIPLSRGLSLIQILIIIFNHVVPLHDLYEYLVSIMLQFERKKLIEVRATLSDEASSTPGSIISAKTIFNAGSIKMQFSPTTEELAINILSRLLPMEDAKLPKRTVPCLLLNEQQNLISTNTVNLSLTILPYLESCMMSGGSKTQFTTTMPSALTSNDTDHSTFADQVKSKFCHWKYNCKIAKLTTKCLLGLYSAAKFSESYKSDCDYESVCDNDDVDRTNNADSLKQLLGYLDTSIDLVVRKTIHEKSYETTPSLLNSLTQIGLFFPLKYGKEIKGFVEKTLLPLMKSIIENNAKSNMDKIKQIDLQTDESLEVSDQIKELGLKLLGKWLPTLSVQTDSERGLVSLVMEQLQSLITHTNISPRIRLASGLCWLRLAQNQSFLALLNVAGLYCLPQLLNHPCSQLRHSFIYHLNKGLFRLKLPLDYMALLSLSPLIGNDEEFIASARSSVISNISRRREFLERHPQYLRDAKLLFAILPEYVIAFVIHMLAHQPFWIDDNSDNINTCLQTVKTCLWFIMEPLIKQGDNYSFIRKLLEKIKHAVDATSLSTADLDSHPNNADTQRLHIAADIALGLLLSKQTNPVLKDYPVEVRLPRTRYIPATNDFMNPDFADLFIPEPTENKDDDKNVERQDGVYANVIGDDLFNSNRVRIQFTPPPRNKAAMKSSMPPQLIKGFNPCHNNRMHNINSSNPNNNSNFNNDTNLNNTTDKNQNFNHEDSLIRKRKAKITIVVPDLEGTTNINPAINNHAPIQPPLQPIKPTKKPNIGRTKLATKRKLDTSNFSSNTNLFPSPLPDKMPVTKRGRVCRPNNLVMKDMVSPTKMSILNIDNDGNELLDKDEDEMEKRIEKSISKKHKGRGRKSPIKRKLKLTTQTISQNASVVLEGNVSVSLERLSQSNNTNKSKSISKRTTPKSLNRKENLEIIDLNNITESISQNRLVKKVRQKSNIRITTKSPKTVSISTQKVTTRRTVELKTNSKKDEYSIDNISPTKSNSPVLSRKTSKASPIKTNHLKSAIKKSPVKTIKKSPLKSIAKSSPIKSPINSRSVRKAKITPNRTLVSKAVKPSSPAKSLRSTPTTATSSRSKILSSTPRSGKSILDSPKTPKNSGRTVTSSSSNSNALLNQISSRSKRSASQLATINLIQK